MHLSRLGLRVIQHLSDGWELVQGKVVPGITVTTLLRKIQDGQIKSVEKVSNATLQSLIKNELVTPSGESLTVYHYCLTPKGKKKAQAPE